MPNLDTLLAFSVATLIFAYMPGPAILYTAAQTIARGPRAGFMAALGIHVGGYFHVIAAAAGLSVLLHAVPSLYAGVKLAGALYLIWLGMSLFRAPKGEPTGESRNAVRSARRAFAESITVEILNPKAALFFLAFLPQFVDPSADWAVWVQFLVLGTIVNVAFSSADVVCVVLAGAVMDRLKHSIAMQTITRRIGGSILIVLGLRLAFDRD